MLRNLEKKVILRAIISKKILHKNKKKRFILISCPFTSQRYYQFSRFILQYNKMHHIQSTYQLIRRHVESNSQHGGSYQSGREGPAIYIFCYSNNNVYFFFISLIDIKPKMGQINIRKSKKDYRQLVAT